MVFNNAGPHLTQKRPVTQNNLKSRQREADKRSKSFIYSTEHKAVKETAGKQQQQHPLGRSGGPVPPHGAASKMYLRAGLPRTGLQRSRGWGKIYGREGANVGSSLLDQRASARAFGGLRDPDHWRS